ncbi:SAM-dependent methyltransferase [Robertkochia solimangrovi]|uniref:SAM-dependent methyltransferase n=1 Tax=Robertkochia solimangrovi TaxID=2213046 RepID=UPI00117DFBC6|nr:SAM-dependent methyltransferase [Robertkochia solimangrovi]TRZ41580.1 SAM-dependent methyltransferase [Robertkochia solimangrovi]
MKETTAYWETRYRNNETGWDIGYPSPPLKDYIDQLKDKSIRILIPGAGNGYEAEYLFRNGFTDITVLDVAAAPLNNLKERIPEFPADNLIQENFFEHSGQYQLIIEQTFFCALDPNLRSAYAEKMHELMMSGAKLAGLLFDFPLTESGPPFGGCKEEYLEYFRDLFRILTLENCYNSIKPRQGKELFFIFEKN